MPEITMPVGYGANVSGPLRIYHEFRGDVLTSKRLGGAATGATGDRNLLLSPGWGFQQPLALEYFILGAGQTILAPVLTANGLNIGLDQAAAEGLELTMGINARSPVAFVVGTDRPFYFAVRVKVEDASGVNPLLVGFRKAEAYRADFNDYDEMAAIGIQGTADPNTIKLATILNNAATVVTDTTNTWADLAAKTLKAKVGANRAVTYELDGAAPAAVAAYAFDAGEVVVPFVHLLNAADLGGAVELISWDCGYQ